MVTARCLPDLSEPGAPAEIDASSLVRDASSIVPLLDGSFLVVWSSSADAVDARRVSASGLPLGPVIDIDESTEPLAQFLVFSAGNDDGSVLVAWTDEIAQGGGRRVRVRGLDQTGSPAGDVQTVVGLAGPVIEDLEPAGPKFLILAYQPAASRDLYATFVDALGIAQEPFFLIPYINRGPFFADASLSHDGALAFLAWADADTGEGQFAIIPTAEIDDSAALVASGHLVSGNVEDILPTETGWLIVYTTTVGGGTLPRIFLLGIDHGGVITDNGVRLSDDLPDFAENGGRLAWVDGPAETAFSLSWQSLRTVIGGPKGAVRTFLGSVATFSPLGGRLGETSLFAVNDDIFPRAYPLYPMVASSRHGNVLATWMGDTSERSGVWVRRMGDTLFCDGFESGDLALWRLSEPL